ncbi:winged helix-turn-helix transcriptional regulator [Robertmurraya sp. Marseille-Q9965]
MTTSPNSGQPQPRCGAHNSICVNYQKTIEFIGQKWVGIIIFSLLDGPKRYYELMEMIEGISDRLLAERLNDLVKEGLVKKIYIDGSLKKVQYELTPRGEGLKDIIFAIRTWVEQNDQVEKK